MMGLVFDGGLDFPNGIKGERLFDEDGNSVVFLQKFDAAVKGCCCWRK